MGMNAVIRSRADFAPRAGILVEVTAPIGGSWAKSHCPSKSTIAVVNRGESDVGVVESYEKAMSTVSCSITQSTLTAIFFCTSKVTVNLSKSIGLEV